MIDENFNFKKDHSLHSLRGFAMKQSYNQYRRHKPWKKSLERCCGLNVHRDSITACVLVGNGTQKRKHIKTFPTFTADITALAECLKSFSVKDVAVESTGIYWKPIFTVLEEEFNIILLNAQHVKNVPGRKTDVKDSEWLCKLLKCGLLAKSFIPPP